MKEYRLPTLNSHYEDLLGILVHEKGCASCFGAGQIKRIRPTYNRIVKNPIGKIIAKRGNTWELEAFARHIAKGEIIANQETFLWYLLDRYACRMEVTLYEVADNEECVRWHFQELVYWLNGLSIKYPHLIHFSPTYGLNVIIFQETYKRRLAKLPMGLHGRRT